MIKIKRGDTFSRQCIFYNDNVNPTDLTNYTIKSQIRSTIGTLISELDIEIRDQSNHVGVFIISCDDTSLWPLGSHEFDISYSFSGTIVHTETVTISVLRSVTQNG